MQGAKTATSAQEYLAKLQAASPPVYPRNDKGQDRLEALAHQLLPILPVELRTMVDDGRLAIGEVGEWVPNMSMRNKPPIVQGEAAIIAHTGQIDFYDAIARAKNMRMVVNSNQKQLERRRWITLDEVAKRISDILNEWRAHCHPNILEAMIDYLIKDGRIGQLEIKENKDAENITQNEIEQALLFMLAHEFGHVAIDNGFYNVDIENEEVRADAFAADHIIRPLAGSGKLRTALSGMAFAIRLTDSLQRVGVEFNTHNYPPPDERMWQLLMRIKGQQPAEQYFDEISTLAVTVLDQFDHIDEYIDKKAPKRPKAMAAWQARVRIIAVLEAIAIQGDDPGHFMMMVRQTQECESPETVANVGQTIVDYYASPTTQIDGGRAETRAKMGQALRQIVAAEQQTLGKIFSIQ